MCDLFWLSSAAASSEQGEGDLSDVVRASLAPPHGLTTEPTAVVGVRDELLGVGPDMLLEGGGLLGGHDVDQEQQLETYACDDRVLSQSQRLHLSRPAADIAERESLATDDRLPAHDHVAPIKRRKSQAKKVVCIPAPRAAAGAGGRPSFTSGEVVPSDLWAWRKYGQKPIKGSPYPRGYYRCSSSKGCSARKQVERSRTDPNMLVITYTSEHNHPWPTQRNALAGSTRPSTSKNTGLHRAALKSAAPALPSSVTTVNTATANHQHHRLKEEVVETESYKAPDSDLDLFAEMDDLIFSKAGDDVGEKMQVDKAFDPFSFFDWVGSSFGEANNKGL